MKGYSNIWKYTLPYDMKIYQKHYDPSFDPETFIEDSKSVYNLLRNYMFNQDYENLEPFLSEKSLKFLKFFWKINNGSKDKIKLETVSLNDARIHSIRLSYNDEKTTLCHICVEFDVIESLNGEDYTTTLNWEFTRSDPNDVWKVSNLTGVELIQ